MQLVIRVFRGQVFWLEEMQVVEGAVTDLITLFVAQPHDPLAHLPDAESRVGSLWAEVNTESMLLVVVPPSFKFAAV